MLLLILLFVFLGLLLYMSLFMIYVIFGLLCLMPISWLLVGKPMSEEGEKVEDSMAKKLPPSNNTFEDGNASNRDLKAITMLQIGTHSWELQNVATKA